MTGSEPQASTSSAYEAHQPLKSHPSAEYAAKDEVIGLTWNPTPLQDKESFYVYTKQGGIEEMAHRERSRFVFEMSNRGHICLSGMQRKTCQAIPFFDSAFNYEQLKNSYTQTLDQADQLNFKAKEYSEDDTVFLDIQNQILNRIKAGYQLDTFERNFELSLRFRGCVEQYTNPAVMMTTQLRGLKSFWAWMTKLNADASAIPFADGILSQLGITANAPQFDMRDLRLSFAKPSPELDRADDLLGYKIYVNDLRN